MHWCRVQDAIALSSAEAELKASCKGLAECLGLRESLQFLIPGDWPLTHFTDASACHALIRRRGTGAIKHLSVRQLWMQEVMQRPGAECVKIPREHNLADAMCSLGNVDSKSRHLQSMNFETKAQ